MGGRHRRLDFGRAFTSFGVFVIGAYSLATNVASWADKWGVGRAVTFVVGGACITVLVALWVAKPIRWRRRISVVLVVAVLASCVTFFIFKPPPQATATGSTAPPVTTVVVPPDPMEQGCGSDAKETASVPDVEICVVYWCTGAVYSAVTKAIDPTQMQYKIRPRIYNSTDHPVNISLNSPSPLRLIVDSSQLPASWNPPPGTVAMGDSVYPVIRDGKQYWAVPPNAVGDVFMAGTYWSGFSTFWDGDQLGPHETYLKKLRFDASGVVIQEGDLVFQLPTNPDGSNPTVLGLAYATGGGSVPMTVEHLFPRKNWPDSSQPMSF